MGLLCCTAFECPHYRNTQRRLQTRECLLLQDPRSEAIVPIFASASRGATLAANIPYVARHPLLLSELLSLVLYPGDQGMQGSTGFEAYLTDFAVNYQTAHVCTTIELFL